ncbi:MAG: asparagine synthase [bacterium]|nr:asparagine synthase [bacterium]
MAEVPSNRPTLAVSFTYPETQRREGPRGVWFASAVSGAALDRLATAVDPGVAGDEVVHRERDASVVFVALTDGEPSAVTAWKGLMALNELYYAQVPGGGWFVTDHFRNAIVAVPEPDRKMSDDALVQHYVGAAVYGRSTYARGVDRLLNGDRVDIDLDAGTANVVCFSRHTSTVTDEPMDRHLDRLDGAFEDVVAPLRSIADLGAGFSGGVDSTLLLSYLEGSGTAITVVPGSPEFDIETEYAREASRQLGRTIEEIQLDETDYLRRLGENIETLGMPVESYVTPVLSSLYEHPSSLFMVGDGADSVFGSGRGIRRVASILSGGIGQATLRGLGSIPGPVGRRAAQVNEYAALFAQPASSPNGYAGTSLEYDGVTDMPQRMLGEKAITRLNLRMLDEVAERVDLETDEGDRFLRHIEVTQWRYIFADLAMAGNHAVQAIGKRQVQPYSSWRVISEHLKVPAGRRYYKGLSGKWMLKELLTRRVPAYKANKRKLATALPFTRYYEDGPLTGFWERYEVPDLIPREMHGPLVATPTAMTWKAMTHAIWEEKVVSNPSLAPHPAAVAGSWLLRH